MGRFVAFYATKHGTGNTMCLVNVAVSLSQWGYTVLAVDLEFEEGPLQAFFKGVRDLDAAAFPTGGAATLLSASSSSWRKHLVRITIPHSNTPLDLLPSVVVFPSMPRKARKARDTYFDHDLTGLIARLRHDWTVDYDFVLLNGRKGVYDTAAATTLAFLPDVILLYFTADQSTIRDVRAIATIIDQIRSDLPIQSPRLICIPIFSRVDRTMETVKYMQCLDSIENELSTVYHAFLSHETSMRSFIDLTLIPNEPYAELAVLTKIPLSISDPYDNIAAMLT